MSKNLEESEMLGMPISTARSKLYKQVLLNALKAFNNDICYRCGEPITEALELSIDHVINWRRAPNAKELYFDTNNIKFSHNHCNSMAGLRGSSKVKSSVGYKGVSLWAGKYIASIGHNNKNFHLGRFDKAEDAARAYDLKAIELFKHEAVTNESLGLLTC